METPRTLILLAKRPDPALSPRIASGQEPRTEYAELAKRLNAEIVDFHSVESSRLLGVQQVLKRAGPLWALAWLGLLRRDQFDILYATGEDIAIPLGILLKAAFCHRKLIAVMHNVGTPKRRAILRLLGHRIYRYVIVLGSSQRNLLIEEARLPSETVQRIDYWCDQRFYRPETKATGDYVLSVGMESRDYPTLQRAAVGLPCRFHVVASGWSPGAGYGAAQGISAESNITVGRGYSAIELRDLYAAARFVVVPLKNVTYAAGVTAIVEGMAMGKAIIASRSPGISDYLKEDISGKSVPVGDADALRQAVDEFWSNPARLDAMGKHNRQWVEESINTDRYVARVAELLGG